MKVNSFISFNYSNRFKEYMLKSFNHDTLLSVFKDWIFVDEVEGDVKYSSHTHSIIFRQDKFDCVVTNLKTSKVFTMYYPNNIYEFIFDCCRYGIDLYWGDDIDVSFKPKEFLNEKQLIDYYNNLLCSIDKEGELNV